MWKATLVRAGKGGGALDKGFVMVMLRAGTKVMFRGVTSNLRVSQYKAKISTQKSHVSELSYF
jgi:hypothetical protein